MEGEGVKQNLVFPTPELSFTDSLSHTTCGEETDNFYVYNSSYCSGLDEARVHCTEETKFKTSSLFVCVFQIHVNLMGITGVRVLKGFRSTFQHFRQF